MGVASGVSYELKQALQRAKKEWNMEPQTGSKYVFFDVMVRDRFGIQLYRQLNAGWSGYDVVDEEKFAWFLLKYSY